MNKLMIRLILPCLALLIVLSPFARGQGKDVPPADSEALVVLRHCTIEYEESTMLSAQFPSLLQERSVQLGQRVKKGQVLGRLFDLVTRAELDMNTEEAESEVQIEISKTELAQAMVTLKKTEALNQRKFVSEEQLIADRFAVERAKLAVKQAEQRKRIAQINRQRSEAEIKSREFVSPHDGIVVGAFKNEGESVILHDPVFRVVNNDRLKVWGALNVVDLWRVKVGQQVRVRSEIAGADLPVERQLFPGQVVFIDTEVDPETQTCKILARVNNQDGQLRAGFQGLMEILPEQAPAPLSQKPIQDSNLLSKSNVQPKSENAESTSVAITPARGRDAGSRRPTSNP